MNADPKLRDRFERAAGSMDVDAAPWLDRVHVAATRRERSRRVQALAVAAVITVAILAVAWELRAGGSNRVVMGGTMTGQIAFLGSQGSADRTLFTFDLAGGNPVEVGEGPVLWAAWSPDGSRLATIIGQPGSSPRSSVVVSGPDGSDPVTVYGTADTGLVGPDVLNLSWAPDGARLAVAARAPGQGRTIVIVDARGRAEPTVLDGTWESVSWSPDGERLLAIGFPTGAPERFDIYTMRPDGSDLVQLTDDGVGEHNASWSPDGASIAFAEGGEYDQDVFVMEADGENVRRLTGWEGIDILPVWSPDGDWIAFASDREATDAQQERNRGMERMWSGLSMFVMRADGSDAFRVFDAGDGAALPTSWAP